MSGTGINPELPPHVPVAEGPPPPGPASPPPAIAPAARTAMRVAIVVIAALISVCSLGGLGAASFALATSRVITDTQQLPGGIQSLIIDTSDAAVPVRVISDAAAKAPRVDLRMVTQTDDVQLAVVSDGVHGRVTIGDGGSAFSWPITTGINVVLPPDVARRLSLTINHRTGPLAIDADLDQLVVKSDAGTVTLGGSARRIDIDAHAGDISTSARIAVTESFNATAESGNISVEFRAAPHLTEAIAGGNVTVGLPGSGPYRVAAGSERGSTGVAVSQTTDPRAPKVTVRSENGNVNVTEIR